MCFYQQNLSMLYLRLANMSRYAPVVSIHGGNTNGSYTVNQLVDIVVLLIVFGRVFCICVIAGYFDTFLEHVQKNAFGNL